MGAYILQLGAHVQKTKVSLTSLLDIFGHTFYCRYYDKAIKQYKKALGVSEREASVHSAIGFTHHLNGDLDKAVEAYHKVNNEIVYKISSYLLFP